MRLPIKPTPALLTDAAARLAAFRAELAAIGPTPCKAGGVANTRAREIHAYDVTYIGKRHSAALADGWRLRLTVTASPRVDQPPTVSAALIWNPDQPLRYHQSEPGDWTVEIDPTHSAFEIGLRFNAAVRRERDAERARHEKTLADLEALILPAI